MAMTVKVHVEDGIMIKSPVVSKEKSSLFLHNVEQQVFFPVEMLFAYRGDPESTGDVVDMIRNAVAKVLEPYYFLAGRIRLNEEQGRVELDCNNAGVLFAGAMCENSLAELHYLRKPDPALRKLLVYPRYKRAPGLSDVPLVTIQVTRFSCGGFVVGIAAGHAIFDGSAGYEFYNSIAEVCRGEKMSVIPNPDRSSLRARSPPQPSMPHPELIQMPDIPAKIMFKPSIYDPEYAVAAPDFSFKIFSFTPAMLNALKAAALEDGTLARCSSFEALTAHVWQARCKALHDCEPSKFAKLFVVANVRHKMKNPPLPQGYCGNCVVAPGCVDISAGELKDMSFSSSVRKVQQVIGGATEEYFRSEIDWCELNHGNINVPGGMIITPWSKLPFHELDFGWGKPCYVAPAVHDRSEYVIILSNCKGDGGVDVFMGVEFDRMNKLKEYLFKI